MFCRSIKNSNVTCAINIPAAVCGYVRTHRLTGLPPKYFPVPIALMDGIIGIFDFLAKIFPGLEVSLLDLGLRPRTWWN